MNCIGVAVIGYGLAGRVFHAPLIAATPGLRLKSVVSSRHAEIVAAYPDVSACSDPASVFSDPGIDLVVVATPNDSHFDLAARALEVGKHVVIDKPFALTAQEARELIANARGRLLSVFHNRRWDGDFLTLKSLMTGGIIGDIAYMESRFDAFRPTVRDRWRERAGSATGIWYDLGAHLVDQALQLFGRPVSITADLAARRYGAVTTDYFRVLLTYKSRRVVLAGNSLAPTGTRFVVHGSRVSFVKSGLDPQEGQLANGLQPDDCAYGHDARAARLVSPDGEEPLTLRRGNYRAYYEGVRDAIRGTAPLPVTASEALAVMEMLEAGERSASQMRSIAF